MRKKLLLGLVIGALLAGALTGAAFAQAGGTTSKGSPRDTFLDSLAQKLGIERSRLDEALKSANTEVKAGELDSRLARLVTSGKLTQAQADEFKAWLNARPASANSILPGAGFMGGPHGRGGHGKGMPEFGNKPPGGPVLGSGPRADPAKLDAALAKLVTAGSLTQAQADEIKAWLNARPASLDSLTPQVKPGQRPGFVPGRGRGHGLRDGGAANFRFLPHGGKDAPVPHPSVLKGGTNG